MSKTQGPHHAPDEPKAQVLALAVEGYSSEHISELTSTPVRTVRQWIARGREVARNQENPLIQDDWVRIVRRSQGHMHSYLDYLDDNPDQIPKAAQTLNIYAGTGTDKLQKEDSPGGDTYNILALIQQHAQSLRPDVIEGEVVEGDDTPTHLNSGPKSS